MPAVAASAAVSVSPLGWNVVGLDSNKVTVGPNQFPVGARVCNDTGATRTLNATWAWQSSNAYINVVGGAGATPEAFPEFDLVDGACRDLYWTVEVTRNTAAYFTARAFQISLSDGTTTVSTPAGRQIYVEKLVSQNRNVVTSLSGPGISPNTDGVYTGQTYTYSLVGATAPGGYEQLVFAAIFPPSMFEVVSVSTTYNADSSPNVASPNGQVYADGCGWTYTPLPGACTGTGKVGGNMTSTITVRAIGAGSGTVSTEIYDFSGSSFHYNADFGASAKAITVRQAVPELAVVKTSTPTTFDSANDALTFTVSATNTGNVPLADVSIADPILTDLHLASGTESDACVAATLAVGATLTCTGTYTTDEDDVIAGRVTNTATGTASFGDQEITRTGTIEVPGPTPVAALSVVKSSVPTYYSALDEAVAYTVVATNTGNVALTNVTVTDPLLGEDLACPTAPATLAPGESMTCTGTYGVTQGDLDAGEISNTATATGTPPAASGLPTVTDAATHVLPGPVVVESLTIVKSANPATFTESGQSILYTVTATNTGNVSLSNVDVSDELSLAGWACPGAPVASLAPGESIVCTGTYVTDAVDAARGYAENTATATSDETGPEETTIRVPGVVPEADMAIDKTVSPTTFTAAGQTLTYTITVTNSGAAELANVVATDPLLTDLHLSGGALTDACAADTLAPSATLVCTGTYLTTAADNDAGVVVNTATATSTAPGGATLTRADSITVVGGNPTGGALRVLKTATESSFSAVGDVLHFSVAVTNIGTSNMPQDITVTDSLGGVVLLCSPPGDSVGTIGGLAPDATGTCTGAYTVTAEDVARGYVLNSATATYGSIVQTGTVLVPGIPASGAVSLVKSASPAVFTATDETITYTITATNTGPVILDDVWLEDAPALDGWSCPAFPAAESAPGLDGLAPGASVTCTGTYDPVQADIENGYVDDTATVHAKDPSGATVTDSADLRVPGPAPAPRLSVAKVSDPVSFSAALEPLSFTIVATNTGNVPLTAVTVTDALLTDLSCAGAPKDLDVGESLTCTGSYTTDSDDVLAGAVENTATATGTPPSGPEVEGETTIVVPGPTPAPALSVVKSADPATFATVGDDIGFTIVATNTGNVPLADVSVQDPALGSLSCPGAPADLGVGESLTCTGTYEVGQGDLDAGEVLNTATATGEDPQGDPVEGAGSTRVPGPTPNPALQLTKSADVPYFSGEGDMIVYTLVVRNAGNVTLTEVVVADPLLGTVTCDPSGASSAPGVTLLVGGEITCTGTHEVSEGDVAYGGVENTATAAGLAPDEETVVSSQDSVLVPSVTPRISVVKTASRSSYSTVSQPITFTIVASNVGNVPLSAVAVTDSWPALTLSCDPTTPVATLAVLEDITCTASYRTTSADLTAGEITNEAAATGRYAPESGTPVDVDDTSDVIVYREGTEPTPAPPAPSPEPSTTPTPTPSSTSSPAPSPTATPTTTPTPAPERLPQTPIAALPTPKKVKPFGPTTLLPATVMTNAGQPAKVRVDCSIPQRARGLVPLLLSPKNPMGDLRLCKVKRGKDGKVSVTVLFAPPVKVTMTLSAPAKGKYGPYKQVVSYTTRLKR